MSQEQDSTAPGSNPGEPSPVRRPYAAGDYLTRYPAGHPYRLRVDSPIPKAHWHPREQATTTRPTFPGTPVLHEGVYYEVTRAEAPHGSGGRWCYYLGEWDPGFPLRQPQEYSPQECHRLLAQWQDRQRRQGRSRMLILLGPLLGLLPAADQKRLENEYGTPALGNTLLSAFLLWAPSTVFVILAMSQQFGSGFGARSSALEWATRYQLVFYYFFLESALRALSAMKFGEPLGSLPVFLPLETVRAVRQALDPQYRRGVARRRAASRGKSAVFAQVRDEVRPSSQPDYDLEIVSLLDKLHWTANQTGIRYGDSMYLLRHRDVLGEGQDTRYRFFLEKADEEVFFRSVCDYTPEEVRDLFLAKRREERRTWVQTFAPLWGFLDADLQADLEEIYGFDSRRFTRFSILAGAVVAALVCWSAGSSLVVGSGTGWDLLALLGGVYWLLESLLRWQSWSRGEIQGGFLGHWLRPAARWLLD